MSKRFINTSFTYNYPRPLGYEPLLKGSEPQNLNESTLLSDGSLHLVLATLKGSCMLTVIVSTIFGNLLVMVSVYRTDRLRTLTNSFVVSSCLCRSDGRHSRHAVQRVAGDQRPVVHGQGHLRPLRRQRCPVFHIVPPPPLLHKCRPLHCHHRPLPLPVPHEPSTRSLDAGRRLGFVGAPLAYTNPPRLVQSTGGGGGDRLLPA